MSHPAFKDLFSGHSADYARYRPRYPKELFAFVATLPGERGTAWDCGTGNGQAAVGLSPHFRRVVATDPSDRQLAEATPAANVEYHAAPAESSGLTAASIDLVTVAQAFHWFRQDAFFGEVRRVARPGAALAIWSYFLSRVTPEIDAVVDHYYEEVVGRFWEPERKLVDEGYRSVAFPFRAIETPPFEIRLEWTLEQFLGYLASWSATRTAMAKLGKNPLDEVRVDFARVWGPAGSARPVLWPIALRAFHVD